MTHVKRITIDQVRLGMYIREIGGLWANHPFWRNAFLLESRKDYLLIKKSQIDYVLIDTSRGLDIKQLLTDPDISDADDIDVIDTGVIVVAQVTAEQEHARATRVLADGKDAVISMFNEARMGRAIKTEDALPLVEKIASTINSNGAVLLGLSRLKTADDYTYMHSLAVCALMVALAKEKGLTGDEVRQAGMAGLLHDIGKMAVSAAILKKAGPLTDEEFIMVKNHPAAGHQMLIGCRDVSDVVLDVCLHHHEKTDGSGYPHKLRAEQISLYAKMAAVCDVYDAITSDRPYKNGWPPGESIKRMMAWSNGHFDKRILVEFIRTVGIYPVGSFVRMASGHLAVVIDANRQALLKPCVKLFFSIKSNTYIPMEIVDLSRTTVRNKIVSHEDPHKWGIESPEKLWA